MPASVDHEGDVVVQDHAAGRNDLVCDAIALPDLLVSELTVALPNIDALLGMDVLRQCLLVLDGPGQQFILGF